jgi:hypothetical protein
MDETVGPVPVLGAPLAGVVTRHTAEYIRRDALFRRYGGSMSTSTRTHGMRDVSTKNIGYAISLRAHSAPLQGLVGDDVEQIDQRFCLNEATKVEVSGILRKYSNFGMDFETADLAGMVFMLAAASAKYSLTGTLTCPEIRDGRPISVTSLAVQDRVTTARDHVFIPRHSALVDTPGLFEALAACANACGSRVVTDVLSVDPLNNAPRLVEPEGAELAQACWVGLRGLLHLHDISGAGAIAALSATKGFHSVATVVAHTDEGGILRSILRKHRYAAPYGGVYVAGMGTYTGLPTYRRMSNASQQCAVDGVLLATAAASAVSDPTVLVGSRRYPTVLLSYAGEPEAGGSRNDGTAADARSITTQLGAGGGAFSDLYVAELARLFMVSGGEDTAARGLCQMFGAIVGTDERHARHRAIAPYYWIEPTSLYHSIPDTPACRHGFGPICGTDMRRSLPIGEDITCHGTHYYEQHYDLTWRSARTTGLAVHMLGHLRGGAGNVFVRQANPEMFAFKGAGDAADTRGAMLAQEDLATFMWGHVSCGIPAPSEMMYVGEQIRIAVKTAIPGPNFSAEQTHSFTLHDIYGPGSCTIDCDSTRPAAIPAGPMVDDRRRVRRARAHAEFALEACRSAMGRGPAATSVHGGISFSEPSQPRASDLTESAGAVALAPEEAREVLVGPVARQGPAEAHVMHRAPMRPRLGNRPIGEGAGVAQLAAASAPIAPGQDDVLPAPPAAAAPEQDEGTGGGADA